MEQVDRYTVTCQCGTVWVKPMKDGHLVMHSDYVLMEKCADDATSAIRELAKSNFMLAERRDDLQMRLNAVVAENLAIRAYLATGTDDIKISQPETDAVLNAVRADAVNHAGKMIMAIMNHQDKGVERALECLAEVEMGYVLANQLRADAAKGGSDD